MQLEISWNSQIPDRSNLELQVEEAEIVPKAPLRMVINRMIQAYIQFTPRVEEETQPHSVHWFVINLYFRILIYVLQEIFQLGLSYSYTCSSAVFSSQKFLDCSVYNRFIGSLGPMLTALFFCHRLVLLDPRLFLCRWIRYSLGQG